MRIVSLLPSLTEICAALGLIADVIAVTHECDYPPAVEEKLRVTRSLLTPGLSHQEIDAAVRERVRRGFPLYELDWEQLARLEPDVILTQSLCPVCAVSAEDISHFTASLARPPRVISVEPTTLEEILHSIILIGQVTGRPLTAQAIVLALRRRLDWICSQIAPTQERPRVLCLEWLDPPMVAGHWVPEMVSLAGGQDVLGRTGFPSFTTSWDAMKAAAPEIIIAMPCGYDLETTAELASELLLSHSELAATPAFQRGMVWAVDASSYFSRPGPRVVRGVEILASIFHPERCRIVDELARPVRPGRPVLPV